MSDPQHNLPAWRVRFYPALVFTLLAGQVLLMATIVIIANSDQSFATEPDYYQKALNWDDIATQRAANQRLNWQTDLALTDSPTGDQKLTCTLTNKTGAPLNGAEIKIEAFSHARGMQRSTYALTPTGEGRYAAKARFPRGGLWEFRVKVTRGPDTFTNTIKRNLVTPGATRP